MVGKTAADDLRDAVWRTFAVAQVVLWVAMVLLSRVRLLTGGDAGAWVPWVGPIAVAATVVAWVLLLRSTWVGPAAAWQVVRAQRWLTIGLAVHVLCLVALLGASLLAGTGGVVSLSVGIGLLLAGTALVWWHNRR